MHLLYRIGCLLLLIALARPASAQFVSQMAFGKNRVQYNRKIDQWLYYESDHFVTYWYGEARNVAQAAMQMAEYDYRAVQQVLEHQGTEKIEIIVFADLTDLKQSNIGSDDLFQLRAGETKVIGNKIFVFFDGNHQELHRQIREGMAGALLNSMLFGANIQEIVQNAVLLNLPGWYTTGLVAYCGETWTTASDEQLRNLLHAERCQSFEDLARLNPRLAGQAFWHYINLHFGNGTLSNLLYLTRINRSVDAGFLYVLGSGYRRTTDAMYQYYQKRYQNDLANTSGPDGQAIAIKNKRRIPLQHIRLSPDGKKIAFVSNDIGKYKVFVQDLKTNKKTRLLKGGMRNAQQTTDYNYPLLAWTPDNRSLGVIYEKRDKIRYRTLEPGTRKNRTDAMFAPEYQRVFSMAYTSPSELLLSAAARGYSDIFLYNTVNRQTRRITNDFWDDLDATPVVLNGKRNILFSSNRISDTLSTQRLDSLLPLGHFDLFLYDLDNPSDQLIRVTRTPLADERYPVALDSGAFAFTTDVSGIRNRQAGRLEPYIAYYQDVIYLSGDGGTVEALHTQKPGEWPPAMVEAFLAPTDSVLANLDSTRIDSIVTVPVFRDRAVTWNQTNYTHSLFDLQTAPKSGNMLEHFRIDGIDYIYLKPMDTSTAPQGAHYTRLRALQHRFWGIPLPEFQSAGSAAPAATQDTSIGVTLNDNSDTLRPGWLFAIPEYLRVPAPARAETPQPPQPKPTATSEKETARSPTQQPHPEGRHDANTRFNTARIVPYRIRFRTDNVSTTIDNNLLFEGLDSYAASPDGFRTPPPGVLVKANFKDLLEDYALEAGFRLPTTFNGAEYYVTFDDKKRQLDKRISLYRKSVVNTLEGFGFGNPPQVRTRTMLGQFELRYPLNPFLSFRARATLREDKAIVLASSRPTLDAPNYAEQRAGLRLSTVFDNTLNVELNVKHGTRAMVFAEVIKQFAFNTDPVWKLSFNEGYMTVLGLDARHYQRLDRHSILALRLAGATSFGSEKILYFLGGIDNWLFPQFNNNIPIPAQSEGFGFQTLAANLRGFSQNIRNGNSYALANAELRIPLFKYLSKQPVGSPFWRNFQVVGFFDVGTAWQGRDPFSGNNPLNSVVIENPPTVSVTVNYFRDPLVAGYGLGVRAMLFGVHVRADYGWGIETRVVQKPVFHLGIGTDF
jgi:hypothetical protein